MPTSAAVKEKSPLDSLTGLIARWRVVLFVLIGVLYVVSFNGQWRIGLDSAYYRGLGASLAGGNGFHFGEWAGSVIYRGFPLVLAGVQYFAGNAAWPAVCIVLLCGVLAMTLVYRLIRLHFPIWMAVVVTFGVGINSVYLQYCHELMTDMPFILGLVMSLYGYERVLLDSSAPPERRGLFWRGLLWLIAGLIVAGSMRPTFWILAVTLVPCAIIELIRRRRVIWALLLAAVIVIATGVLIHNLHLHLPTLGEQAAESTRASDASQPAGGYANEFLGHVANDSRIIIHRAAAMLYDDLPKSFFGVRMGYFGAALSLAVILFTIGMLARHHLPWALLTLLTIGVTLLWSTQSRYYTMVLPFLLLGWLQGLLWFSRRLPRNLQPILLALGMLLVTTTNIVMDFRFVREQRAVPFLATYKAGKYVPLTHLAELIRNKVPTDQAVIGPSGSILSYLSGRHVYTERELLQRMPLRKLPLEIRELGIGWAVFPARAYERERHLRQLMVLGILRRGPAWRGGITDGMLLAPLRVAIVHGDWTKQVRSYRHGPLPATRPHRLPRRKHHPPRPATTAASTGPTTRPTDAVQ